MNLAGKKLGIGRVNVHRSSSDATDFCFFSVSYG